MKTAAPGANAMLNVDLSTLRGQELRQLLDTTRQRGEAKLTYEILQEMEARRERGEPNGSRGLFGGRRATEPRPITLSLGDPLDDEAEEFEAQAAEPVDDPEPAEAAGPEATAADEAPIYLHPEREAEPPPRREPPGAPPPGPPPGSSSAVPRRWLWVSSGIALGLFVGLAIGGWADGVSRGPRPAKPAVAAAPALAAAAAAPTPLNALPPASAAPIDPIAVETETAPDAITPPVAPPVAAAAPAPKPPPPEAPVEVADDSAADAPPAADAKPAKAVKTSASAAGTDAKACAAAPTPADRTICESPRLQRLQKQLREAYAEALQAHQDRDTLRQRQLSWRDARNDITEPDELAQLYEQRIKKLNAATADAKRQQ